MLFKKGEPQPMAEIPFPDEFRIGNVFTMIVFDLDYENVEYGYRMDGPFDPAAATASTRTKILLDPYARVIGGRDVWGSQPDWNNATSTAPGWSSTTSTGRTTARSRSRWRTWSSTRRTCAASPGTRPRASSSPAPSPACARRSHT